MKCKEMGVLDKMDMLALEAGPTDEEALRLWCKHTHGGGKWLPIDTADDGPPRSWGLLRDSGALDIVSDMQFTTWENCERVLDTFFYTMEEVRHCEWR